MSFRSHTTTQEEPVEVLAVAPLNQLVNQVRWMVQTWFYKELLPKWL